MNTRRLLSVNLSVVTTILLLSAVLLVPVGAANIGVTGFQTPPMSDFVPGHSVFSSVFNSTLARIDALELQKDTLPLTIQASRLARVDALELQKDALPSTIQASRLARIDALESQKDALPLSIQGARLAHIDALELQKDVVP